MIQTKCMKCGKVIEGYTENQVNHMLEQHLLTHKLNKTKSESNKMPLDQEKEEHNE